MENKKIWMYGILLLSVVALAVVIFINGTYKAYVGTNDTGGTTTTTTTSTCGYTETAIKVMNDWQKNGILNICQQQTFINAADDVLFTYSQTPQGLANLKSYMTAVNQLLADPNYLAAAKASNYTEMHRIEQATLSPQIPNIWPLVTQIQTAFKNSGGKKIVSAPFSKERLLGIEKAYALTNQDCKFTLEVNYGSERDCWKPLKWPRGWESGPSPIGLPGWNGVRNPKDLPGWQFGGGPFPGGGDGAIIMPPHSGGWGFAGGTSGGGWVGIGGGGQNGGGFLGVGSGGTIIIGGGIKF